MARITAPEKETTSQYIKEFADNPYCLKLIQFFGWRPGARYSLLAILHAFSANGERLGIEHALQRLVNKGIIKSALGNYTTVYYLTDAEPLQKAALEMAGMDWHRWQEMLRQTGIIWHN